MEIMRRVNWNRAAQVVEEEEVPAFVQTVPTMVIDTQPVSVQTATAIQPKVTRNRSGNGHKSEMIRKLNDIERDFFRSSFLQKNGMVEEDYCLFLKAGVSDEVAIFQVTGFISYLHRDVAQGRTQLHNLPAYLNWMRTKYGTLWAQYNNPRFTAMRNQNQAARNQGRPLQVIPISSVPIQPQFSTTPNFVAFSRRRSTYARTGT